VPPPLFFLAQEPRFDSSDLQRLLRAILPANRPDPFGRLEELAVTEAEENTKSEILQDKFRDDVFGRLDKIESRTFGILFLQIFKTLKLFMGFLPQGRIILIVLAGIGLLTALLQDGEVSVGSIRDAVRKTGLADFIDKIFEELNIVVGQIADDAEVVGDVVAELFVSIAGNLDNHLDQLGAIASELVAAEGGQAVSIESLELKMASVRNRLIDQLQNMAPTANAAANGADLISPILRNVDDRVRGIPGLAAKLVRFG